MSKKVDISPAAELIPLAAAIAVLALLPGKILGIAADSIQAGIGATWWLLAMHRLALGRWELIAPRPADEAEPPEDQP